MNFREALGLLLIAAALVLVPAAWAFSRLLWLLAFLLFGVGGTLFYTERMHRRQERLDKAASGSGGSGWYGAPMPTDIHNYTGWRTGGRSQNMDESSDTGGSD